MTIKTTDADLNAFVTAAREKTQLDLGYETGKKYARIFEQNVDGYLTGRVSFRFIDMTNGNVLRADGWARPKLKVRNPIQGNIYDDQKGCGLMRAKRPGA